MAKRGEVPTPEEFLRIAAREARIMGIASRIYGALGKGEYTGEVAAALNMVLRDYIHRLSGKPPALPSPTEEDKS